MKLRFSRRASRDIEEIGRYIFARNPVASLAVGDAIRESLNNLVKFPEAGRVIGHGLRRFAMPRLPYLIFYRTDAVAEEVLIVTIRHTARRPQD